MIAKELGFKIKYTKARDFFAGRGLSSECFAIRQII
jgi:hypothetical protein